MKEERRTYNKSIDKIYENHPFALFNKLKK